MKRSDTYKEMNERVKSASTDKKSLERLNVSASRLYNAGLLNVSEFKTLDLMIFDRLIALEDI